MEHKVCATVIAILQLLVYISVVQAASFYRAKLCDVQTRMSNRCMTQVSRSESTLNCCVRCNSNSTCLGASLQVNTSTCYLHSQCNATSNCSNGDTGFKYFLKKPDKLSCVSGSTWDEATGRCKCNYPRVGTLCQLPANCTEFAKNYPSAYGDSMISMNPPPITKNVIATCSRTKTNLSTLVLRNTGELNFNKTWNQYAQGFLTIPPPYNLSYWVGMDAFRAFLGPTPRDIRINIVFNSTSPSRFDHRYTGVVIGDSSTNYLLKYDTHTALSDSPEGYCLELSNMTSFSTFDSDHDNNSTVNWAAVAGAGWWFPSSNFTCNPLGSFYGRNTTPATNDGYVRFSGVNTDLIKNNLLQLEIIIEETYV